MMKTYELIFWGLVIVALVGVATLPVSPIHGVVLIVIAVGAYLALGSYFASEREYEAEKIKQDFERRRGQKL